MALNAVLVDNRILNEPLIADRLFDAPARRNEIRGRFRDGRSDLSAVRRDVRLRIELRFVAARAAATFARHDVRERAHDVTRAHVLIEHFKEERLARRDLEVHRPVRFDRDDAENTLDAFRLEDGDRGAVVLDRLVPRRVRFRVHLNDADVFAVLFEFGVLFRPFEDVVAVQFAHRELLIFADLGPLNDVRADRVNIFAVDNRGRVIRVVLAAVDEFLISVDVHEIEAEEPAVVVAAVEVAPFARAHEEVFFAERIGRLIGKDFARFVIVDFRFRIGRAVSDFRPRDFARYAVEAVGIVQAGGRVDNSDRAVEPRVVADGGEDDLGAVRNGARFGEDVGPRRLVPVERLLVRAVRIHRPERLNAPERLVGIFPARKDNAPVVHHGGQIFRFAVRRDDVNVFPVGIAAGHRERVRHGHAADVAVLAAGAERDLAVGRIDRIEVVVVAERELLKPGAVQIAFVKVERLVALRFKREEELFAVVGDFRTPEGALVIFEHVDDFAAGIEPDDEHTPARLRHKAVPMARFVAPFVGRVARFAFRVRIVDEDDLVERNERVLKGNVALDFADFQIELFGEFGRLFGGVDLLFELV